MVTAVLWAQGVRLNDDGNYEVKEVVTAEAPALKRCRGFFVSAWQC